MTELHFHPVADIFPMMSELEFAGLVDDIREHGLREPVWLHSDGRIIDGRNRYRACRSLAREPDYRTYGGPDAELVAFVVSLNLHRRHLDSDQRSMVAARIATISRGGDRGNQHTGGKVETSTLPQDSAAKLLKVSRESVIAARKVLDSGDERLIAEAEKGRKDGGISISAAAAAAGLAEEQRQQFLAQAESERTARLAKQMRRDEAEARQAVARLHIPDAVADPVRPPEGKFSCVVIDPPWPMQKIERVERPDQGRTLDYPVMSLEDIAEEALVPVRTLAADDCHIYLWVTHKFLPAGMDLLEAWGFNYQCVMTWRKNVGITPFSWMYDTEHVLFGRRGNLPLQRLGLRLSFEAPVQGHSVKPDVFYERVTAASPGPRVEMFARRDREGFIAWGNEVADVV